MPGIKGKRPAHLQSYYARGKGKRVEIRLRDSHREFIEALMRVHNTKQGDVLRRIIATHPIFRAFRECDPKDTEEIDRILRKLDI